MSHDAIDVVHRRLSVDMELTELRAGALLSPK
jgi:hypothetical protein